MTPQTVAIFGGTFAPVHSGHMELARHILEIGMADEVWLMPCRRNPLKEKESEIKTEERLELLNKAVCYYNGLSGKENIKVSEIELTLPAPSYTSETLKKLKELHPEISFRIIVGADSYLDFEKWKDYQWIENNFAPVVYPRPGYEITDLRKGWTFLKDAETNDISSTKIRESGMEGKYCLDSMPWIK